MGRFYNGTISGKFWFGSQSSNDASNFKPDSFEVPSEYFEYFSCGCNVIDFNQLYCHNCYKNYQDHFHSLDDYDKDCIEDNGILAILAILAIESGHVEYEFNKSELSFIQYKLKSLEIIIGEDNIKNFNYKIGHKDKYFEYTINDNALEGIGVDNTILSARWCLGKQIEAALIELGECYINCEL